MAIRGDICSKIQAWNSQLLGLRADSDVSMFKKKPLKVCITKTSLPAPLP